MAPPLCIVVEHATSRPGEDSQVAAEIAGLLYKFGALPRPPRFVRLHDPRRRVPGIESTEHVTVDGTLVPNGLVWAERALGQPLSASVQEAIDSMAPPTDLAIVAFNPCLFPDVDLTDLRRAVRRRSNRPGWIEVTGTAQGLTLSLTSPDGVTIGAGTSWRRDDFGRLGRPPDRLGDSLVAWSKLAEACQVPPPGGGDAAGAAALVPAPVLVVGEPDYLRSVYPAVLAALGDAADTVETEIGVTLLSPHGL